MDDLIGADLLVLGPKAVVIPSYTPRVCYNQQTVRCIHTVSVSIHLYSILLFFVQCWTIKNFKDRYVPSRTEWPHRRLRTLACFVKPIKTKLKPILIILPRRLRKNNSSASTLPSEIERHFESKIFTQGLSMYFNLVRARTMWKLIDSGNVTALLEPDSLSFYVYYGRCLIPFSQVYMCTWETKPSEWDKFKIWQKFAT